MRPRPGRFDFVTSMELTAANKDVLVDELLLFVTGHEHAGGTAMCRHYCAGTRRLSEPTSSFGYVAALNSTAY